jgi:hypothetical protein
MYDLSNDPIEVRNLARQQHPMEATLKAILDEQCAQKALTPQELGRRREQGEGALVEAVAAT